MDTQTVTEVDAVTATQAALAGYEGPCFVCGEHVRFGDGVRFGTPDAWRLQHSACSIDSTARDRMVAMEQTRKRHNAVAAAVVAVVVLLGYSIISSTQHHEIPRPPTVNVTP